MRLETSQPTCERVQLVRSPITVKTSRRLGQARHDHGNGRGDRRSQELPSVHETVRKRPAMCSAALTESATIVSVGLAYP